MLLSVFISYLLEHRVDSLYLFAQDKRSSIDQFLAKSSSVCFSDFNERHCQALKALQTVSFVGLYLSDYPICLRKKLSCSSPTTLSYLLFRPNFRPVVVSRFYRFSLCFYVLYRSSHQAVVQACIIKLFCSSASAKTYVKWEPFAECQACIY